MKNRIATLIMAALLVLYLALVTQYAVLLITTDNVIARVMGIALIVLPIIAAWTLAADLLFVIRGERLVKKLGELGELPVDNLPRLPSGRPDREAADKEFPQYQAEVEANPSSWKAWVRLGLAYDASGDRKRARWATRHAIALERGKTPPSVTA
ncbi:hypothetical protein [Glaciihabitans sp. dw_435]|uniref:hypothetical protein n=1 Tax=Glaciihabitans sp. dw_435 TaxID=2720081 RepID=UPI001BD507B7|nr:hypothetical protein [Glaciihabitans sp. dw_435]